MQFRIFKNTKEWSLATDLLHPLGIAKHILYIFAYCTHSIFCSTFKFPSNAKNPLAANDKSITRAKALNYHFISLR